MPRPLRLRKLCNGNTAEADDLAQETFIAAYKSIHTFKGNAGFSTLLYRIACNKFISSTRSQKFIEYHEHTDTTQADINRNYEQVEARYDLNKSADNVSKMERISLILSYGYEFPHEHIANILNKPVGTVKSLIMRGREKMRKNFATLHVQEDL